MVRLESLAKNVFKMQLGDFIPVCTYRNHPGIIIRDYEKCEQLACNHYLRVYVYTDERRTEK